MKTRHAFKIFQLDLSVVVIDDQDCVITQPSAAFLLDATGISNSLKHSISKHLLHV